MNLLEAYYKARKGDIIVNSRIPFKVYKNGLYGFTAGIVEKEGDTSSCEYTNEEGIARISKSLNFLNGWYILSGSQSMEKRLEAGREREVKECE